MGCSDSSEDSHYWTKVGTRAYNWLRETVVPSCHRGGRRRGHPARPGGSRAPGDLRRAGRFRRSAKLLEPDRCLRQDGAQVDALGALPRLEGGRADPQRASRRRDAELGAHRRDRAAVPGADPGDPRGARQAVLHGVAVAPWHLTRASSALSLCGSRSIASA